jgi:LemA protein
MNKRTWIILGIIVVVLFILYQSFVGPYNNMATMKVAVEKQWGQVQVQYQQRADLIPQLVETVKGYAHFEQSTLTEIAGLRSQAGQAKVNFNDKNLSMNDQVRAANQMEGTLARLMVVVEKYPDLKANQNFMALQSQLEGTEHRVANERRKFNDAVGEFNSYIVMFPKNMIASMFNFKQMEFFKADAGAEKAPKVKFD